MILEFDCDQEVYDGSQNRGGSSVRLKEELKTRSPCCIIMSHKIISWPSKL